LDLSLIN